MEVCKYEWGNKVKFSDLKDEKIGYIYIVDRYGTSEQKEEPSYDILIPKERMMYKHVRQSEIIERFPDDEGLTGCFICHITNGWGIKLFKNNQFMPLSDCVYIKSLFPQDNEWIEAYTLSCDEKSEKYLMHPVEVIINETKEERCSEI